MRYLYLVAASAAALTLVGTTPAQAKPGDKIAGSYICVFKGGVNAQAEASRAAGQVGGSVRHIYQSAIRGFSASMSGAAAAQLQRRNPAIAYCEQDQEVAAIQMDPLQFRVVGRPAPAPKPQKVPWGINRVNGGAGVTPAVSGAVAWVIDTGIDLDHPDLNVDTGRSRNFSSGTSPDDGNGHGTHVSGTIAAKDDAYGVIGVVPGASVVAVRVLNNAGTGSNSDVIAGVDYVAREGHSGDVANMSLGGGPSQALDDSIKCAADGVGSGCSAPGVVKFALAAGNESESATLHSPARVNGTNIYTVAAFAQGDNWSSFSNFGKPPVDYAEPGSSIYSTYKNGGYATLSGTSMATPHLAGILLARGNQAPVSDGSVNRTATDSYTIGAVSASQ